MFLLPLRHEPVRQCQQTTLQNTASTGSHSQVVVIKPTDGINPQPGLGQSRRHGRHEPHRIQARMYAERDFPARENGFETQRVDRRTRRDQRPPFAFAEEHFERVRFQTVLDWCFGGG